MQNRFQQRQAAADRDGLHAGERRDALHRFAMKGQQTRGVAVLRQRQKQAQREHVPDVEAELHRGKFLKALDHQSGAGDQHQGESDFDGHHDLAEALASATGG